MSKDPKKRLRLYIFLAQAVAALYVVIFVVVLLIGAPWNKLPWALAIGGMICLGLEHLLTRYWTGRLSEISRDDDPGQSKRG
jgi:hypothetical protein